VALRAEPTSPADLDGIAALLRAAFDAPADAPFVNNDLLRWKYLEPSAGHTARRSYVLRQGSEIVAHCAMMPLTFSVQHLELPPPADAEPISGACFMDWVGDRRVPGAGVTLLKKVLSLVDVGLIAGGSPATRALAPRLGFTQRQTVGVFARVIRPIGQARTRPRTGLWRDAARLARNTVWSLKSVGQLDPRWRAIGVSRLGSLPETAAAHGLEPLRTPSDLVYWLRCPAAAVSAFEIHRQSERAGYFLMCRVNGQARLVDLRLRATSQSDWELAYRVAVQAAEDDPSTCELVTLASTPAIAAALEACGFRRRGEEPLFVHDKRAVLPEGLPIVWSMANDDTAYMHDAQNPYVT
jgi:hypothetical protein